MTETPWTRLEKYSKVADIDIEAPVNSFCSWWSCFPGAPPMESGAGPESADLSATRSDGEVTVSTFGQTTKEVERLLSERLVQGYVLLEKACPACATPLIKQDVGSAPPLDKYALPHSRSSHSSSNSSTGSSRQQNPVPGIAYCVQCRAHVVTRASEVEFLERKQRKGQILVDDASYLAHESGGSATGASARAQKPHQQRDDDGNRSLVDELGLSGTESSTGSSLLKVGSFHLHQARARRQRLRQMQKSKDDNGDESTISTAPNQLEQSEKLGRQQPKREQDEQNQLWEVQQAQVQEVLRAQQEEEQEGTVVGSVNEPQEGTVVGADTTTVPGDEISIREGIVVGAVAPTPQSQWSQKSQQAQSQKSQQRRSRKLSSQDPPTGKQKPVMSPTVTAMEVEEIEVIHYDEDISLLENQTIEDKQQKARKHDFTVETVLSHESTVDEAIKRSESGVGAPSSSNSGEQKPPALDFPMPEYKVRREMAIKILAGKLVQGYTIAQQQCNNCNMPLMEKNYHLEDCFVCQSLRKRYLKKKSSDSSKEVSDEEAKRRLLELVEKVGREHCTAVSHGFIEKKESVAVAPSITAVSNESMKKKRSVGVGPSIVDPVKILDSFEQHTVTNDEAGTCVEGEDIDPSQREAFSVERAAMEHVPSVEGNDVHFPSTVRQRDPNLPPKPGSDIRSSSHRPIFELLSADAAPVALNRMTSCESPASGSRGSETSLDSNAAKLVALIAREKQRVVDETRRLEELEKRRAKAPPKGIQVLAFLEEEAEIKIAINEAIQARNEAEAEARRLSDEKRVLEEEKILAQLERDAAEKQKLAEFAMEKARAALARIQQSRHKIMGNVPVEEESVAVAKAEKDQDKKSSLSSSELFRERWSILRAEGRSVMTRRLIAGWSLLNESCRGAQCEGFLLLSDGKVKRCAICGGSGSGTDGVYAATKEATLRKLAPNEREVVEASFFRVDAPLSPTMSLKELHEDFDSKRDQVSKEIGKRMMKGWTLLDMTCPHCVMPLMTDEKQEREICVLCGPIGKLTATSDSKTSIVKKKSNRVEKNERSVSPKKGGRARGESRSRSTSPSKRSNARSTSTKRSTSATSTNPRPGTRTKTKPSKKSTANSKPPSASPSSRSKSISPLKGSRLPTPDAHRSRSISPSKHGSTKSNSATHSFFPETSSSQLSKWKSKVMRRASSPSKERGKKNSVANLIQQMENKLGGKSSAWPPSRSTSSPEKVVVRAAVREDEPAVVPIESKDHTDRSASPKKATVNVETSIETEDPAEKNPPKITTGDGWTWSPLPNGKSGWKRTPSPKKARETPKGGWTAAPSPKKRTNTPATVRESPKDAPSVVADRFFPKGESPEKSKIFLSTLKEQLIVKHSEFIERSTNSAPKIGTPKAPITVMDEPTVDSFHAQLQRTLSQRRKELVDRNEKELHQVLTDATEESEYAEEETNGIQPDLEKVMMEPAEKSLSPSQQVFVEKTLPLEPREKYDVGSWLRDAGCTVPRPSLSRGDPPAPNGSFGVSRRSLLSPGGKRCDLRLAVDQFTSDLKDVVTPIDFSNFVEKTPIDCTECSDCVEKTPIDCSDCVEIMLKAPDQGSLARRRKDASPSKKTQNESSSCEDPSPTKDAMDEEPEQKSVLRPRDHSENTPEQREDVRQKLASSTSDDKTQKKSGAAPRKDVMMLEIPKNFDVNNREAIRRLIEAATSESEIIDVEDARVSGEGHRAPSPGMSAATVPRGFGSPSSYVSGTSAKSFRSSRSKVQLSSVSERQDRRAPSLGNSAPDFPSPSSYASYSSYRTGFESSRCESSKAPSPPECIARRAPSPGISTAPMPSKISDSSCGTRSRPTLCGRPRITPETPPRWPSTVKAGLSAYLPDIPHRNSSDPSHRKQYQDSERETQPRLEPTGKLEPEPQNSILDVERIRKASWREGRDEVIVIDDEPNEREQTVNSASLDALLERIEKTKSQLEEVPPDPSAGGSQYRLRNLIDTLSKAANEMDQIESSTYYYSDR